MLDQIADIENDPLIRRERAESPRWIGEIKGSP
jgi:hypothetical protein